MLPLAIDNKKYLTVNLSKVPNFIFTLLVKFYTTFIKFIMCRRFEPLSMSNSLYGHPLFLSFF